LAGAGAIKLVEERGYTCDSKARLVKCVISGPPYFPFEKQETGCIYLSFFEKAF